MFVVSGMQMKYQPTVIDLFAGAGLFSHAFASQGFKISSAIEMDSFAAATYAKNLGNHIRVADISRIRPSGNCDVLVAGPPCQGFSTLGKRDVRDPRNFLSLQVVRWAKVTRPKVIVIENVAAFLNAPIWSRVQNSLQRQGYEVSAKVFNASDYGVPQHRLRSFTFASKIGMPSILATARKTCTVRDAWVGLASNPDGHNWHCAPTPSQLALKRMRLIPAGGDKRDVMRKAPKLCPPSWWSLNCQVTDAWGRMEWDQPSNTLRTCLLNPSKGRYIHPDQNRVISLREAARLHTIPDHWQFHGKPTNVAKQIGNSVPPALGQAIASGIQELFN